MSEQQPQPPVFSIEKLYVKDLSLEVPNAPKVFLEREQPAIEVQLNTISAGLDQGIYEVTVTVTVTAKLGDKTMFLVEATQAGIFQIRNVPDAEMEAVLGIACPNIIFPYARETIADVIARAGFPAVHLAPINFEAYHAQKKAALAGQEQQPVTTH